MTTRSPGKPVATIAAEINLATSAPVRIYGDRPGDLAAIAQRLAADEVVGLDRRRALVDRQDLGVAVELRGAGFLDVAHAAVDLDAEARHLERHVGEEGFARAVGRSDALELHEVGRAKPAAAFDTYARALFDSGRIAEAVTAQQKALDLGKDNLDKGLETGLWTFVWVSIFMIVYYFSSGAIAVLALAPFPPAHVHARPIDTPGCGSVSARRSLYSWGPNNSGTVLSSMTVFFHGSEAGLPEFANHTI